MLINAIKPLFIVPIHREKKLEKENVITFTGSLLSFGLPMIL